jgi:hypothetical protein
LSQVYFALDANGYFLQDLTTTSTATAITIALVTLVSPRAHENEK